MYDQKPLIYPRASYVTGIHVFFKLFLSVEYPHPDLLQMQLGIWVLPNYYH